MHWEVQGAPPGMHWEVQGAPLGMHWEVQRAPPGMHWGHQVEGWGLCQETGVHFLTCPAPQPHLPALLYSK